MHLKPLLAGHSRFEVMVQCNHIEQIIKILSTTKVDILLTDIMMPILNGTELAKLVKTNYPQIKILALSISGQGQLVNKMIEDSDISGYILKNLVKQNL